MSTPSSQTISEAAYLSVRVVNIDHYMARPGLMDRSFCSFSPNGVTLQEVPIIRIFGATEAGQKTCLHVHRAFPYLYIPYTGLLDPPTVHRHIYQLGTSLNHAMALSYNRSPTNPYKSQFIAAIVLVKGVPFYGYHVGHRYYLKIYFLNPAHRQRVADLLQSGAVMGMSLQPHEAHIPFELQFMMDYNLFGMGMVRIGRRGVEPDEGVRFRAPLPERARVLAPEGDEEGENAEPRVYTVETVPERLVWAESVAGQVSYAARKVARCEIEVDTAVMAILNRDQVKERDIHANLTEAWGVLKGAGEEEEGAGFGGGEVEAKLVKSLAVLWEDESRRREHKGLPSTIPPVTQNESRSPHAAWSDELRLREMVRRLVEEDTRASEGTDGKEGVMRVVGERDPRDKDVMTAWRGVEALYPKRGGGGVVDEVERGVDAAAKTITTMTDNGGEGSSHRHVHPQTPPRAATPPPDPMTSANLMESFEASLETYDLLSQDSEVIVDHEAIRLSQQREEEEAEEDNEEEGSDKERDAEVEAILEWMAREGDGGIEDSGEEGEEGEVEGLLRMRRRGDKEGEEKGREIKVEVEREEERGMGVVMSDADVFGDIADYLSDYIPTQSTNHSSHHSQTPPRIPTLVRKRTRTPGLEFPDVSSDPVSGSPAHETTSEKRKRTGMDEEIMDEDDVEEETLLEDIIMSSAMLPGWPRDGGGGRIPQVDGAADESASGADGKDDGDDRRWKKTRRLSLGRRKSDGEKKSEDGETANDNSGDLSSSSSSPKPTGPDIVPPSGLTVRDEEDEISANARGKRPIRANTVAGTRPRHNDPALDISPLPPQLGPPVLRPLARRVSALALSGPSSRVKKPPHANPPKAIMPMPNPIPRGPLTRNRSKLSEITEEEVVIVERKGRLKRKGGGVKGKEIGFEDVFDDERVRKRFKWVVESVEVPVLKRIGVEKNTAGEEHEENSGSDEDVWNSISLPEGMEDDIVNNSDDNDSAFNYKRSTPTATGTREALLSSQIVPETSSIYGGDDGDDDDVRALLVDVDDAQPENENFDTLLHDDDDKPRTITPRRTIPLLGPLEVAMRIAPEGAVYFTSSIRGMWSPEPEEREYRAFFDDPPVPRSPTNVMGGSEERIEVDGEVLDDGHGIEASVEKDCAKVDPSINLPSSEAGMSLTSEAIDPDGVTHRTVTQTSDVPSTNSTDIMPFTSTSESLPSTLYKSISMTSDDNPNFDLATLIDWPTRKNNRPTYVLARPAPTAKDLECTLTTEHGLPHVVYREPYFSKEADVPRRPMVFAGKEFRLRSGSVRNLKVFNTRRVDSTAEVEGEEKRKGKGKGKGKEKEETEREKEMTALEKLKRAKGVERGRKTGIRTWSLAREPPTLTEVERWLKEEEEKERAGRAEIEGIEWLHVFMMGMLFGILSSNPWDLQYRRSRKFESGHGRKDYKRCASGEED
ncbi:hypothetical protein BC936DRAFT_148271 [Jimgerdemannia flammicorona]|uniref:DNA-directed DNA polymerase n=1 Tax=Jimgerdemannia flammicorona TaxID=994334 RepID=A0A433D3E6_9FUNG|nr:hypothetical protein BC936DRAFT_148271 [Jimgerdemannia flammicorona]